MIIKVQEMDERSFPQNTDPDQSNRNPQHKNTKAFPTNLKILNHKPKTSWVE